MLTPHMTPELQAQCCAVLLEYLGHVVHCLAVLVAVVLAVILLGWKVAAGLSVLGPYAAAVGAGELFGARLG